MGNTRVLMLGKKEAGVLTFPRKHFAPTEKNKKSTSVVFNVKTCWVSRVCGVTYIIRS